MTEKELADHGHMWGADKEDYCLMSTVPGETDPSLCFIINRTTKTIVLIENPELVRAVMQRMLDAGVEIVSEPPA